MNSLQTSQFWVGLGLVIPLLIFAGAAFFRSGKLEAHQWTILRFLLALCGGFSGALMAGDALFKLTQQWGVHNELTASGTAGFALALIFWFTFPTLAGRPADDYAFRLPEGWTFEDAANKIAEQDQSTVDLTVFNSAELAVQLRPRQLRTKTVANALASLQQLAPPGQIRKYTVSYVAPTYYFNLA